MPAAPVLAPRSSPLGLTVLGSVPLSAVRIPTASKERSSNGGKTRCCQRRAAHGAVPDDRAAARRGPHRGARDRARSALIPNGNRVRADRHRTPDRAALAGGDARRAQAASTPSSRPRCPTCSCWIPPSSRRYWTRARSGWPRRWPRWTRTRPRKPGTGCRGSPCWQTEYQRAVLSAEARWLTQTIWELRSGALTWSRDELWAFA